MTSDPRVRIGLIGFGACGPAVASMIAAGQGGAADIVGVLVRDVRRYRDADKGGAVPFETAPWNDQIRSVERARGETADGSGAVDSFAAEGSDCLTLTSVDRPEVTVGSPTSSILQGGGSTSSGTTGDHASKRMPNGPPAGFNRIK